MYTSASLSVRDLKYIERFLLWWRAFFVFKRHCKERSNVAICCFKERDCSTTKSSAFIVTKTATTVVKLNLLCITEHMELKEYVKTYCGVIIFCTFNFS